MSTEPEPEEGGAFFILDENGKRSDEQLLGDSEPSNEASFNRRSRATFTGILSEATLDSLYGPESKA